LWEKGWSSRSRLIEKEMTLFLLRQNKDGLQMKQRDKEKNNSVVRSAKCGKEE
jgi:hypothetical protein